MKNIPCISIEDAIGKTVAAIVHNGWDQRVVIKFADGTLLAFHAETDYNVLSLVCLSELNLMRDIYDNDDANTLGLLSQRKACIEEHDKEMQRVHEEQERQTFERLKKKFEGLATNKDCTLCNQSIDAEGRCGCKEKRHLADDEV